jgi:hypothetical protein
VLLQASVGQLGAVLLSKGVLRSLVCHVQHLITYALCLKNKLLGFTVRDAGLL